MISGRVYIDNRWLPGSGTAFESESPVDGGLLWRGAAAGAEQVDAAVTAAQRAQPGWAALSAAARMEVAQRFRQEVAQQAESLALAVSRETGKPQWESKAELAAVQAKVAISCQAYLERSGEQRRQQGAVLARVSHRPQGVVAVFGPYNFPAHLPNGHILPALIAGNAVIFKPSELTPMVAELLVGCWQRAGLPPGLLNLLQGGRETGASLARHSGIDGLFFTGSSATGQLLHSQFAGDTGPILALEMGGNNPLLVWQISDPEAAAYHCVQSAYLTAGQRCTCARRLIVADNGEGERFLQRLTAMIDALSVGAPEQRPEPFMGPVIDNPAAERLLRSQAGLLDMGALPLRQMRRIHSGRPFLTPGLLDCSDVADAPDEEYFGPLLQCYRVSTLDHAVTLANRTRFGLAAGVLSDSGEVYRRFYCSSRAGIVNWNRPLTGASSAAPFGGSGDSGNHRPGAYYAADYCAYPVASLESEQLRLPDQPTPGISF